MCGNRGVDKTTLVPPLSGCPYLWTDERPDPASYVQAILPAITERQR